MKNLAIFALICVIFLPSVPILAVSSPSPVIYPRTTPAISPNTTPGVSQDFSIVANTTSITASAGATKHVLITVSSIGGFSGKVPLDAFAFAFPIIKTDVNPKVIDLSSQPTANSELTVTIPSDEPPGSYTVSLISGATCSLFHSLDIPLTVTGPDFTIVAEKTHLTIAPSGSDTSNIDLASLNGFASVVSLTPHFSQIQTSLSLPSVPLTSGGTGQSTLTVTAPPTIAAGDYTVAVEGFANGHILSHMADILVTITGPSFALTAGQYSLTLVAGGQPNSTTITVTPSGFTGTVSLGNTPAPPIVVSLSATSVTLPGPNTSTLTVSAPATAKPDTYLVVVTGSSNAIQGSALINVKVKAPDFDISASPPFILLEAGGISCSSTITVASIDGFSSSVGLVLTGAKGLTSSLSPSSVSGSGVSTLTLSAPTGTAPGSYTLEVNGTSSSPSRTHSADVEVLVIGPDFIPAANPDSLTVLAGSTGTSTLSFSPVLGFIGTVSLKATSIDPSITPTLDTNSITGSQTAKLTVSVSPATFPGPYYSIEINATSGNIVNLLDIPVTVIGPGFYLTANLSRITVNEGTSTTSIITIVPTNGFSAPVDLFVIPSSGDLNASIQPATVTSNSYSATLSVNSTIPGHYSVDILGSSSSISGFISNDTIVDITVVGPDFSVSTNPTTLTITAGGSKTSTVSVTPSGGFNSPVDLNASPPTGITMSFNPTTITSSTTSILTITVDPSVTPGTYTIDIHGTSGKLDRTTQLVINVAGFTLATSPDTLTIVQGTSQSSTITVAPENGFTGTVQLSNTVQTGLTITLTPPSVTGGPGTSQLSIAGASNISPGTYLVNVTGTSGSLTQKVTITVTVPTPDFDISPSTHTTVQCVTGNPCSTTITIAPRNGFTGTVSFTAIPPALGLTCPTPTSITLPAKTQTDLSCTASAPGSFDVTVTGASGTLSHTTGVITFVVAPAPDFTIAAGSVTPSTILAGASGTSTITVSTVGGFSGAVSFQVSASTPAGLMCIPMATVSGQGTSTLSCNSSTAGDYTVTVTGTGTIGSSPVTRTTGDIVFHIVDFSLSAGPVSPSPVLATSSASSIITLTDLNGFSGTVAFAASASSPAGLTCNVPGSVSGTTLTSTLSCNSSTPGDYTITVTGTSGTLSHTTTSIVFHVSGFTVVATSPAAANTGETTTSTITITPVNGFTGTVQLSNTPLPSGLLCSAFNPASVTITSAAATATLGCYSTQDGTFTVSTTATSGSLTPQATATFTFHTPDITITSTTPVAVTTGQSATSTITISPVYSFTGTLTLSISTPSGITCTLDHTTVSETGTSTLTCTSNTSNDYTVIVTATGAASPHTTTETFHISAAPSPDITITSSTPASATASEPATSTITVSPTYGFTGTVNLSVSAPSGITCTLDHSTLQGSGTATLTCNSNAPSDYTVVVTATGGATQHTTTQTFHVSAAPSPTAPAPTILGLPPGAFYGIIGVIIAAVIGGIAVVIRRRNP